MSEFAIIHSKSGPLSDDQVARAIWASKASRHTTAAIEPHLWIAKSRRFLLASWGETNEIGFWDGRQIAEWEDYALAMCGFVYSEQFTTPSQFLQTLATATDRDALLAGLGGSFAIGLCDGARGCFTVWSAACGFPNVVFLKRDDLDIATTRPAFASIIASPDSWPKYDTSGLGRFIALGNCSTELTVFSGVEQLDGNAAFHSCETGSFVSKIDGSLDGMGESGRVPTTGDFDETSEIFLRSVRELVSGVPSALVGVSGGKDSRLIAAAIRYGGMNAVATCHQNWPDHPDLVIGKRIIEELRLNSAPIQLITEVDRDDPTSKVDVDSYLLDFLRQSDCRRIAAMGPPSRRPPGSQSLVERSQLFSPATGTDGPISNIHVSGIGGEIARGGFTMKSFIGERDWSADEIKDMAKHYLLGSYRYLRSDHIKVSEEWFDNWYLENKSDTVPFAVLERYYLYILMNRVTSPVRGFRVFSPYTDQRLVKHLFKYDISSRRDEVFHLEMLKRFAPGLVNIPLAVQRWGFEHSRPRPGDEAGYEARTPLQHRIGSRSSYIVRDTAGTDLREFFRESFFHRHKDLLDTILDYKKLGVFLQSEEAYEDVFASRYWNAHSGALVTTNRWIDPLETVYQQQGLAPSLETVRLDAPWNVVCFSTHRAAKSGWASVRSAAEGQPVSTKGLRDIAALDRLLEPGEFVSEPERVVIARSELVDGNWRIDPEPDAVEERKRGAGGGATEHELDLLLTPKQRTNTWIVVNLGKSVALAGKALRLTFAIRTSPGTSNILYVMKKNHGELLHQYSVRTNESWTTEAVEFEVPERYAAIKAQAARAVKPGWAILKLLRPARAVVRAVSSDPADLLEVWFPANVEARTTEFGLRIEALEESRESKGTGLARVALRTLALGRMFRNEFVDISNKMTGRYGMTQEMLLKYFADFELDPPHGGQRTTLRDVVEDTNAWRSFQLGWLRQTLCLEPPRDGNESAILRPFRVARACIDRRLNIRDGE